MATKIECSLDDIKPLSPEAVKSILNADKEGNYILLDVRQPEEYQDSPIPGAKLIPLDELERRMGELDKDKKIITCCRSGRRSMGAAVLLCGLGFKDVYTMRGGSLDWHYETVTGPPEEGMGLLGEVVGPREALLLAFRLENGSLDFYSKASENLKGKSRVLPKLLDMEKGHISRIYTELAIYWRGTLPTPENLQKQLNGVLTEAGITVNEALLRFEDNVRDDLETIEVALEMEAKSYDLYKRMAAKVGDSGVRKLFQKLAAEEREHLQQLSGELKHFL